MDNHNLYIKSQLSTEELLLVQNEVQSRVKDSVIVYILWFVLGYVGGHRYYMGKIGSGLAMTLIVVLTMGFGLLITLIWAFVDLFLISSWTRDNRREVENQVLNEVIMQRQMRNDRIN